MKKFKWPESLKLNRKYRRKAKSKFAGKHHNKNPHRLEKLEPRLLLSAAPLEEGLANLSGVLNNYVVDMGHNAHNPIPFFSVSDQGGQSTAPASINDLLTIDVPYVPEGETPDGDIAQLMDFDAAGTLPDGRVDVSEILQEQVIDRLIDYIDNTVSIEDVHEWLIDDERDVSDFFEGDEYGTLSLAVDSSGFKDTVGVKEINGALDVEYTFGSAFDLGAWSGTYGFDFDGQLELTVKFHTDFTLGYLPDAEGSVTGEQYLDVHNIGASISPVNNGPFSDSFLLLKAERKGNVHNVIAFEPMEPIFKMAA